MVLGLIARGGAGHRLADQGDRDDRARPAARPDRHRRQLRRARASRFDIPELTDGIGFVVDRDGHVRLRRDHRQPRARRSTREVFTKQGRPACCRRKDDFKRIVGADPARHRARLGARHPARRRRAARRRSPPTRWRRSSPSTRRASARAPSRASPGPEAANNAGAQTSFIPLLTLGIPPNAVMALMIGAMMIQGIQPGPQVMTSNPELFWGLIASMWIGNLMLVILNLPLIGIWVKLLTVPYRFLFPAILLFCCIGVYIAQQQRLRRLHDGGLRRHRLRLHQARAASRRRCCSASSSGR